MVKSVESLEEGKFNEKEIIDGAGAYCRYSSCFRMWGCDLNMDGTTTIDIEAG